jgi:hypothetical protein
MRPLAPVHNPVHLSQVYTLLPGFVLIRCNLLIAVHPKQQTLQPDNDGLAQIDEIGRQDQFVAKDEHKTHTVYSSAFVLISPIFEDRSFDYNQQLAVLR